MAKSYRISEDYPVNIETLWNDILDPQALSDSMKGRVAYIGLPTETIYEGQVANIHLKYWGWLPLGAWRIEVVRVDHENHILETREGGGMFKSYHHRLELVATGDNSCRYTDNLTVDAGIFTALAASTVPSMYRERHRQRRARLVARG